MGESEGWDCASRERKRRRTACDWRQPIQTLSCARWEETTSASCSRSCFLVLLGWARRHLLGSTAKESSKSATSRRSAPILRRKTSRWTTDTSHCKYGIPRDKSDFRVWE